MIWILKYVFDCVLNNFAKGYISEEFIKNNNKNWNKICLKNR